MKYISVCDENLKVDIEAGQVCVCVIHLLSTD